MKKKNMNYLNFKIQNQIFSPLHCATNENEATNYPTKTVNSLDVPGLTTEVWIPVIMTSNQPKLCDGTRLTVRKCMGNGISMVLTNSSPCIHHDDQQITTPILECL